MENSIAALILIYNDTDFAKNLCIDLLTSAQVDEIVIVDNSDKEIYISNNFNIFSKQSEKVHYIKSEKNGGYAAGNNIGIQYILQNISAGYIWILNNDIIVKPGVASAMVKAITANQNKAICGSVLYYNNSEKNINDSSVVQCYGGGIYYPVLGKSKLYLKRYSRSDLQNVTKRNIDFLSGASMMVPVELFSEIGLIPEEYFMYNEELDWQKVAMKNGYKLIVSDDSELIHMDSLSTKSRKHTYYYYLNRATIIFTKKYYRLYLSTVLLYRFFEILFRTKGLKNKQYSFKGIKDGFLFK